MNKENSSEILIYEGEGGKPKVSARIDGQTAWLTQAELAELYGTSRPNVTMHIKNIFEEGELDMHSVCKDFLHTAADGKNYKTKSYNLELVVALGYRVKSEAGTRFRQWATARLSEYIVKGFTMDDARLKGSGGGAYWKELLERIRDIRSSEKALYRQVLDLYTTSIDYSPKSKETTLFFKVVQNKIHYATNKQTAAELIHSRADAEKDFMGLTTFAGALPVRSEISIAKNYLNNEELFRMNRLVNAFFDLAELKAQEQTPMHMKDWVAELDKFSKMYGKGLLLDVGKVGHEQAIDRAEKEYKKYQAKTLSPVEEAYLDSIKEIQKRVEKKVKSDKPSRKK
jgi:hypothetical protein